MQTAKVPAVQVETLVAARMILLPTSTQMLTMMTASCEYAVPGCTDATACNYNPDATEDNGSCSYADAGYDCEGNCLNDAEATVFATNLK